MRHSIKCSQCDETFPAGFEYRMHWEDAHLDGAIIYAENKLNELRRIKDTDN